MLNSQIATCLLIKCKLLVVICDDDAKVFGVTSITTLEDTIFFDKKEPHAPLRRQDILRELSP